MHACACATNRFRCDAVNDAAATMRDSIDASLATAEQSLKFCGTFRPLSMILLQCLAQVSIKFCSGWMMEGSWV
jgi:hypothetical protein